MRAGPFILIAILASPAIPHAYASCSTPTPILSDIGNFREADTIFVGKVIDMHRLYEEDGSSSRGDQFTFDVAYYLKGELKDDAVLSPHNSVKFYGFEVGESYLVYAFGKANEVSQCSAPVALSSAGPVLALFYFVHYSAVIIPAIAGGTIFAIWKKRKKRI